MLQSHLGKMFAIVVAVVITVTTGTPLSIGDQENSTYRCERITDISLCSSLPEYRHASFPNFRGHTTQTAANNELETYVPLLHANCSDTLIYLLCAVYAPICFDSFPDLRFPPCKGLCVYARRDCEPILQELGYQWPPALDCNRFTTKAENGSCIQPTVIKTPDHSNESLPMAQRFEIEALGPNTVQFMWSPPGTKNNVIVYNYLLSCEPQPEGFPIEVHSQSDEVKQTLGGFEPDTEYECDIVVSRGGVSGPRVMQTTRTPSMLAIHLINDSPIVGNGTVRVELKTNRPSSHITCHLLRMKSPKESCSNGSIIFPVVSPGRHILRIVAKNNKYDRDVVRRRVTLPEGPEECIVNLINDRVTYTGTGVMVEFVGIGPLRGFFCRLDDGLRYPCSSPHVLSQLESGKHRFKVVPIGTHCRKRKACKLRFTV